MSRYAKLIFLGALAPLPLIVVHLLLGYYRDTLIGIVGLDSFYFGLKYSVLSLLVLTTIGLIVITRKMRIAETSVAVCLFAVLIGLYVGLTYVVQIGHSGHWEFAPCDLTPFCKYMLVTACAVVVIAAIARATIQKIQRR
jgi:hypothetical protein